MDFFARKTPAGFILTAESQIEDFEQIRNGTEGVVTFKVPNNLKFHKKFMAMLRHTLQRADVPYNFEQWRRIVIAGAGWCDYYPGKDGMVAVPRSIKFDEMEQAEREKLYWLVLNHICDTYIHDTADEMDTWLQWAS